MGVLNFTLPIDQQHTGNALRVAMAQAVSQVMADTLAASLQDLVDYGTPHMGQRTVIERFSKQDGLAVLRRSASNDKLMQVIYANWLSLASERGLGFLQFVLQMLFPDQWDIVRLWHSIDQADHYPRFLSPTERNDRFLTSRIQIRLSDQVNRSELSELAPILRRLVPANIVPQVTIDVPTDDMALGAVVVGQRYHVYDFSPVSYSA
jgi:hypothetical protein